MRLLLIFFMSFVAVSAFSEEEFIFVDTVSSLSVSEAADIWAKVDKFTAKVSEICKEKKGSVKVKRSIKVIQDLKSYAVQAYNENRYRFGDIKVKDGKQELHLSLGLKNIAFVLNSHYINYNEMGQEGCKAFKSGFVSSYASFRNLHDKVDVLKAMPHWASSIYSAFDCLCS